MDVRRRGRARQPGEGDVVSQGVSFETETAQSRRARGYWRRSLRIAAQKGGQRRDRVGRIIGDAEERCAALQSHGLALELSRQHVLPGRVGQAGFLLE